MAIDIYADKTSKKLVVIVRRTGEPKVGILVRHTATDVETMMKDGLDTAKLKYNKLAILVSDARDLTKDFDKVTFTGVDAEVKKINTWANGRVDLLPALPVADDAKPPTIW